MMVEPSFCSAEIYWCPRQLLLVPEALTPLNVVEPISDDDTATDSEMKVDSDDDPEYDPRFDG